MRIKELQPARVDEGAQITQSLVRQVMADPRFTFGFESEFVLYGLHEYVMGDAVKDASTDRTGAYQKMTALMTFNDLIRFWVPLGEPPDTSKSDDPIVIASRLPNALKRRIMGAFEDVIRPLGDEDFAKSPDYRGMFDQLRSRMGLGKLLLALKVIPTAGFSTSKDENLRIRDAILSGQDVPNIERMPFRLHFRISEPDGKTGSLQAMTTDHTEDPLGSGAFYLTKNDHERDIFLTAVATDIKLQLGDPVSISLDPKDNQRASGGYSSWLLTEDGTVTHDYIETAGLELVSPVSGLSPGLANLQRVFAMIGDFHSSHDGVHTETDDSTGLHINLGIRGFDPTRFDFLKLIFLLGEQHLLQKFGRVDNDAARSILTKIKNSITIANVQAKLNPSKNDIGIFTRAEIEALLGINQGNIQQIKDTLINLLMTRANGEKTFEKHLSVNLKKLFPQGFIEFRITGNKGYERRFDEIKQVVYRYAVMMLAATSDLYQNEYMTKLYKFVSEIAGQIAAQPNVDQKLINHVKAIEQNPFAQSLAKTRSGAWHELGNIMVMLNSLKQGKQIDLIDLKEHVRKLYIEVQELFTAVRPDNIMRLKWSGLKASLNAIMMSLGQPVTEDAD